MIQPHPDPVTVARHMEAVLRRWPEPRSTIRRLIARDGLCCHWCGALCNPIFKPSSNLFPTKEHLVRVADGGKTTLNNLVVACRKCNNGRHSPGWVPKVGGF